MSRTWRALAEALGIENEGGTNWQKANQRKNMQRYGTQDRRDKQSPMAYFNNKGTGSAQRQATAANMQPSMTPKPGGLQIPSGTDRPGQPNPLMQPTRAVATRPTTPTQPASKQSWVDMLSMTDDEDDQV